MSVQDQLEGLNGLTCRNFRVIAGGSLILYLGEREGSQLTEWRLHLEPAWRLEGPSGPLAGSFDVDLEDRPTERLMGGIRSLVGRVVEHVWVSSPVLDLSISFFGGYRLLSFAHSVSDGGNWEFRHRSGMRLAMRAVTECVESREAPDECAEPDAAPDRGGL
jgi:hypothetical protein